MPEDRSDLVSFVVEHFADQRCPNEVLLVEPSKPETHTDRNIECGRLGYHIQPLQQLRIKPRARAPGSEESAVAIQAFERP